MNEAAAVKRGAAAGAGQPPIDRRAIPPHAVETVWIAPDGHEVRRIDWPGSDPARPRGSILFLPGRGDHYEKYLEALEQWHRAGWRVTASDWRGQGASGRLGKDAVTGHVEDFAHWVDDLAHLWERWKAETPGPHVLAAHSMGGHLSMRAAVEGRVDPDAVVLSAPMLGMNGPPLPLPALHAIARTMTRIGDPARQAWKWSEKPGEMPAARNVLLTHDDDRYEDEIWWRRHRPELVMGPASWRWLERAYASWRGLEEAGALEAVETPVLILSTSADKLVSHPANVRAARRLPHARLVEFGSEARHEILREADPVRTRAMDAIAAFLDEVAPARD
ncbi:lysophospholipase [Erythrobacter litoralis]|jgi:lysophospholipase|uniref:Lysophospholipase n=1 Tax=Erythrobacter litoralis TaxID=39960 RepID=A0A074MKP2_9SPHN|nr:alpha/beta hydrolase [Erythrobacter litoralis]AOL24388.1 lysophospholipase [Erythrobacter litoralis]KEO93370.1 lysophospholipase [Erythrobacter litoralis]MEE4338614.1 alpha/beta hydrolase [Erythrobacter sp.]